MDLVGLSEQEVDQQCDKLFAEAPIKFVPRQSEELDLAISIIIEQHKITIPILHIKDRLYLIGSQRMTCEIKREILMIRVGGGFEKFFEWVPKNHRYLERCLVVHMIKSGESLEWVIEQLFNGK